jgi:hypothetical protein
MSREWRGPINNLADAFKARRHLWVLCTECGHAALVDPRNLIGKLGEMLFQDCNPGVAARLTRSARAAHAIALLSLHSRHRSSTARQRHCPESPRRKMETIS